MKTTYLFFVLACAPLLAGCGADSVDLTSDKTELWETDVATLTCTLKSATGTAPTQAHSCDIDVSPSAAGSAATPIRIAGRAGSATGGFTAATVDEDTTATVTASWNVNTFSSDPADTVAITVHPPRVKVTSGQIVGQVEPAVSRTAQGLLRYRYDIKTLDANAAPPSAIDELFGVNPTFTVPVTVRKHDCENAAGTAIGATQAPSGRATAFTIPCNVPSARMVLEVEVDGSTAGNVALNIVTQSGGTIAGSATGPQQ